MEKNEGDNDADAARIDLLRPTTAAEQSDQHEDIRPQDHSEDEAQEVVAISPSRRKRRRQHSDTAYLSIGNDISQSCTRPQFIGPTGRVSNPVPRTTYNVLMSLAKGIKQYGTVRVQAALEKELTQFHDLDVFTPIPKEDIPSAAQIVHAIPIITENPIAL